VDAVSALNEFPFRFRHTEYNELAREERGRLSARCEELFAELKLRVEGDLRSGGRQDVAGLGLLSAGRSLDRATGEIGTPVVVVSIGEMRRELSRRLAAQIAHLAGNTESLGIPVTSLLWRPGPACEVRWGDGTAGLTFGEGAQGREIAARLPDGVTWNLSGYSTIDFVVPDAPADASFLVKIETSGGEASSICRVEEAGVQTVGLKALGLDLARVRRISLILAEPAGKSVSCTLKLVVLE
jgi:hypothetical protein